jgi:hypothetical protein
VRVTFAGVRAQTTRANGRCICCDPQGRVHMVWEDARHGAFEVYYNSALGDSLSSEVRLTHTKGESSYPAVACDSENVYVVWEDLIDVDSEIMYARLQSGEVVAETRLTNSNLDSSCPVSAVGPDGSLHIAWHEGPFKQTAIYYGRVVGDSLVEKFGVCTKHPEAFRPDIACDLNGRVMVAWPEGLEVKARLYDGSSWGAEELVANIGSRPWRLSVAGLSDGRWAVTWFERRDNEEKVFIKYYDGKTWYDQTELTRTRIGYYPNIVRIGTGAIAVGWEEIVRDVAEHTVVVRCFDGTSWSAPIDIYRHRTHGRYVSLAAHDDFLYAVWFSAMEGSNEIYYGILRRE